MTRLEGRDVATGRPTRVEIEGPRIASVEPIGETAGPLEWLAPAFWDIQTNGRLGVSFSDPALTVDQVAETIAAHARLGTARLCPTLITASRAATLHGVRTIAEACDRDARIGAMVVGIHLEGPSISERDGYRGAHPIEHVRDPDWTEFEALQAASGGRIRMITLAPERPGSLDFVRRAVAAGLLIALGHTAADPETIRAAAAAGARLSTHLGNGIASPLPRHPNPIWTQAACDELGASFIADGHHLDGDTLRVLARAKGRERTVLVSDASPLAGLPPGRYGDWEVEATGRVVVAGTPYLAGANRGIDVGILNLLRATGWPLADVLDTTQANPARLLGQPVPTIAPGQPANLIRFAWSDATGMSLRATCVDGAWFPPTG